MAPHQQRVVDEKSELDDKITKLKAFICENPLFSKLDGAEQARLTQQHGVMSVYSNILGERIAAFT